MNLNRRFACYVLAGALVIGFAGVSVATPEWVADVGLDFWSLPGLIDDSDQVQKHSEDLDQQSHAVVTRIADKTQLVDELYNGNLTFRETAARFRNLNASNPMVAERFRSTHTEWSADECEFRNVIEFARNSGGRYPDETRFVARLNDELRILKDRGELRLAD